MSKIADAAKLRAMYDYIQKHPGCRKDAAMKAAGYNGSDADAVLVGLEDAGLLLSENESRLWTWETK